MSRSDFRFWRWSHFRALVVLLACAALLLIPLSAAAEGDGNARGWRKNIAFGKTVWAEGEFFTGGFGTGRQVDFSSLVDGVFFPAGRAFDKGPIWWDEDMDAIDNFLEVYLGGVFKVRKIVIQVDNNDDYRITWLDLKNGVQTIVVVPPDVTGMAPPVTVYVDAITDSFTISNNASGFGDGLYSVSEFQAFGRKYKSKKD